MDIQTRKIEFIQAFLKLQSEDVIAQLEQLLQKESTNESDVKPMTMIEFESRIQKSTEDSQNGRLTENDNLISEIEKWN